MSTDLLGPIVVLPLGLASRISLRDGGPGRHRPADGGQREPSGGTESYTAAGAPVRSAQYRSPYDQCHHSGG